MRISNGLNGNLAFAQDIDDGLNALTVVIDGEVSLPHRELVQEYGVGLLVG